jgi:hypothetical protein
MIHNSRLKNKIYNPKPSVISKYVIRQPGDTKYLIIFMLNDLNKLNL